MEGVAIRRRDCKDMGIAVRAGLGHWEEDSMAHSVQEAVEMDRMQLVPAICRSLPV